MIRKLRPRGSVSVSPGHPVTLRPCRRWATKESCMELRVESWVPDLGRRAEESSPASQESWHPPTPGIPYPNSQNGTKQGLDHVGLDTKRQKAPELSSGLHSPAPFPLVVHHFLYPFFLFSLNVLSLSPSGPTQIRHPCTQFRAQPVRPARSGRGEGTLRPWAQSLSLPDISRRET